MRAYILITLFLCAKFSLFGMEKQAEYPSIQELSDKDIEAWIASLDDLPVQNIIVPLTLEPIIHEAQIEKPTKLLLKDLVYFFEVNSNQNPSEEKSVKTVIRTRNLSPVEKIIRAIRCSDVNAILQEIRNHPTILNEKKQLRICDLIKSKDCRKQDRFFQEVTPLLFSCYQKNALIAKKLLENKADPNLAGHNGITPLLVAASNGCYEIAEELILAGAKYDKCDHNKNTPLKIAEQRNNTTLINLFNRHKRIAAAQYHMEQNQWLVKLFDAINNTNNPFEVYALLQSELEKDVDRLLLCESPSIYSDKLSLRMLTALHFSCYKDNLDAVKILLARGANPNVVEHHGVTPLIIAATRGASEIAFSLLQNGARKHMRENLSQQSAAELAAAGGKHETKKVIMYHPS